MDKDEALKVLAAHLERYRRRPYDELSAIIGDVKTEAVLSDSGREYQLEVQIVWDDQKGGNIRVIGSIDDGGLRSFAPLSRDFIMAPDGRFVDE